MIKKNMNLPIFGGEVPQPLELVTNWNELLRDFRTSEKVSWAVVYGKVMCEVDVDRTFALLYQQGYGKGSRALRCGGEEFGNFMRVLALRLLGECVGHRVQYIAPNNSVWDVAQIRFMEEDPYVIDLLLVDKDSDKSVEIELAADKTIPSTKTSEILIPTRHGVGTLIPLYN